MLRHTRALGGLMVRPLQEIEVQRHPQNLALGRSIGRKLRLRLGAATAACCRLVAMARATRGGGAGPASYGLHLLRARFGRTANIDREASDSISGDSRARPFVQFLSDGS